MRTPWTPDQRAELDDLLRSCVECGLCLPHCATWLDTGNEVHSPRGRLLLLSHYLQQDGTVPEADFRNAMDLCIGCMACTAACPSGVPFTLLEQGKHSAMTGSPRWLIRRLDDRAFLQWIRALTGLVRGLCRFVWGLTWRSRLEKAPLGLPGLVRLLGSVPSSARDGKSLIAQLDGLLARAQAGANNPPAGQRLAHQVPPLDSSAGKLPPGQPVVFFEGCANAGLMPGTSARLRDLLVAAGCRVTTPSGQDCCGALAGHTGRPGRAAGLARRNREALGPALAEGALVVAEAAGCSLELGRTADFPADRVIDAGVLLDRLNLPVLGPVPLSVVYHDPCHARHGQGVFQEPRRLLQSIPQLKLVESSEPEVCCGAGGAWGLSHPEISDRLGRRKAASLVATGADLILTGNPGCMGQIGDSLALLAPQVPILPLTDLIWYAWQRGKGLN